ncbi:extracellular solute-binding protein [Cryptosporangium aurantiacum]|uniref:Carbohydrate ABC transporter substrate-binding protein, CUT1 family n=1 Tax=Cryptosporangium aurantiacum TaxID=134849 RepID=A0A1M7P774_9ACTN|nr:extracellular solute-binding protein [Cryptosporangium aurantiacum]SHN12518.1 carbohydrate ABC transporter substrate-binding protein, CUT1 family [Cryptosporangium aurantiacum]
MRGLTWDHPRGYEALAAAGDLITWDTQPLEGFEAHPLADLAERYDLLVIDHPHLGEAVSTDCLVPLDSLFSAEELAAWGAGSIGATMRSYHYAGRQWAVPLDAAAQVCARRPDLLPSPPSTWDEVLAVREPVALSLAGPHAFLTLCSLSVALGGSEAALDVMATLHARAPVGTDTLNPIGLLERAASTTDIALIPLVFGYVNYAPAVRFSDAPGLGSTLGGTGLAITRRCAVTPELLDHVRWLMREDTQCGFIPAHAGQPSARRAWETPGFYADTARTLDAAWVRPRHPGFIPFQARASALVRDALDGVISHRTCLAELSEVLP